MSLHTSWFSVAFAMKLKIITVSNQLLNNEFNKGRDQSTVLKLAPKDILKSTSNSVTRAAICNIN